MPPRYSLAGSSSAVGLATRGGIRSTSVVDKQLELSVYLRNFTRRLQRRQDVAEQLSREVRALLDHIHSDPFDPDLNVRRLKEALKINDNNVSTRFRCALGISLREYIEALRIDAARHLLDHVDAEIYLIATAVGYNHQETFTRAFRRLIGCAPSDYGPTASDAREEAQPSDRTAAGRSTR